MSTLTEIQKAVEQLSPEEHDQFADWWHRRIEAEGPEMTEEEEAELLASLDEAMQEMEEGKGIPIEEALERLRSSRGK